MPVLRYIVRRASTGHGEARPQPSLAASRDPARAPLRPASPDRPCGGGGSHTGVADPAIPVYRQRALAGSGSGMPARLAPACPEPRQRGERRP